MFPLGWEQGVFCVLTLHIPCIRRLKVTSAEWRIEVELRPPHGRESISKGMFLHHLLRSVAQPQPQACLSRTQFSACYNHHLLVQKSSTDELDELARSLLKTFCNDHVIHVNRHTHYPMQPRPHDFVPGDVREL